ncbi:hypothetical protein RN001_005744 [Aquatica leii]|uniref:BESS domain-containing protein n=1 Tax=Aquatica leii TaxID=1421715 RepID=A0AAN7Q8A4_9COLE|nr:hypothetical protein RN001_005744 [Aquatica leii]
MEVVDIRQKNQILMGLLCDLAAVAIYIIKGINRRKLPRWWIRLVNCRKRQQREYYNLYKEMKLQYYILKFCIFSIYSEDPNRPLSAGVPNEAQLPTIQKTLATPMANSKPMLKSTLSNKNLQKIIEEGLLKGSQPQDEVDMFLLSLAPMLRSFDPATRLQIQIQFHQILLNKLQEN